MRLSRLYCPVTSIFLQPPHLKGNGGLKQAVQKVKAKLKTNRFVCKTDIADYYASIQHDVLLNQLRTKIKDNRVMRLLHQILNRVHVRQWGAPPY